LKLVYYILFVYVVIIVCLIILHQALQGIKVLGVYCYSWVYY